MGKFLAAMYLSGDLSKWAQEIDKGISHQDAMWLVKNFAEKLRAMESNEVLSKGDEKEYQARCKAMLSEVPKLEAACNKRSASLGNVAELLKNYIAQLKHILESVRPAESIILKQEETIIGRELFEAHDVRTGLRKLCVLIEDIWKKTKGFGVINKQRRELGELVGSIGWMDDKEFTIKRNYDYLERVLTMRTDRETLRIVLKRHIELIIDLTQKVIAQLKQAKSKLKELRSEESGTFKNEIKAAIHFCKVIIGEEADALKGDKLLEHLGARWKV